MRRHSLTVLLALASLAAPVAAGAAAGQPAPVAFPGAKQQPPAVRVQQQISALAERVYQLESMDIWLRQCLVSRRAELVRTINGETIPVLRVKRSCVEAAR